MAKTTNILLPDGSTIQVPAWATETTLVAMAQQVQRTNVLTSKMLEGVKEMAELDEEVITAIKNTVEATKTNAETNKAQSEGQSNMVLGAVGAIKDTASFFGDSEKPLSSMVGAIKELVGKVSGPGGKKGLEKLGGKDGMSGLTKFFEKFGGSISVVGDVALAWAGWNAAKFEQFAEVQQKMIDSGSIFYASALEFDRLYEDSFKSGVTYNAFADTISNYGATMTALGGNVSQGSKQFLGMFKQLSNVTDSMGDLGMQNTELMNQYAAYLEMARLTGQIDQKTMKDKGKELGQSFTDLVVESTALASLTKLNRSEALQVQLAALSDVRLAAGTSTLRDMGLDNQAKTIDNIVKQVALIAAGSEGAGRQVFENIAEAMNKGVYQFSENIENFDLKLVMDRDTVNTLQAVAPGLIESINTKVKEGSLAEGGVQTFLMNEMAKVNTKRFVTDAAEGPAKQILEFQGTALRLQQNFKAVIGKGKEEMKKLNDTTKKKLEAAGTTVEALNDAAKMFLTAQQAITLDINELSVGVKAVSGWFEEHTGLLKEQATKFFNPEAETEYNSDGEATTSETKKVSSEDSIINANSSDPYLGYHQQGKAMAEALSKKTETENNAVVTPPLPTTAVYNRTNATLNEQLTSYTDHVKMLEKNLTEAKKKDIELYKEQISLIEAEQDAREKKKKLEQRNTLKHYH